MMRIEVEAKVGAAKGQHSKDRAAHFSRFRARSGHPDGHGLPAGSQGPQGRLCAVLHLGASPVRAGADRGRSGSLHQRRLDAEDRAPGSRHGHREHLRIEYAEDWASERNCIREDKVLGSLDRLHELTAQAAN
jgi:hypothetical protein